MKQAELSQTIYDRIDKLVLILSLSLLSILYIFYILNMDLLLNSEKASEILYGVEIFRQKNIFLTGWYYFTDFSTLKTPLFIALFYMISGKMILALRLATMLEITLVVLSILYMFKRLDFDPKTKLMGLVVFFGIRGFMGGDLIGLGYSTDAIYYVMLFLVIGYYFSIMEGIKGRFEKILKIALPALAFIYGLGSIKLLIILFLPILLIHTCVNLWRNDFKALNKNGILWDLGIWTLLCLVGYLILSLVIATQNFGPVLPASGESVGLYYAVVENIPALLNSFLINTPLNIIKDTNIIFSPLAVNGFVFLFFIFYMIYILPIAFKKSDDKRNIAIKYIGISLFFTFFLMIIHLDRSFITSNDLMYIYPFLTILIVIYYSKLSLENKRLSHLYIIAFGVMIILNTLSNFYLNGVNIDNNPSRSVVKYFYSIRQILETEGVSRGYALYWDSYPIEVLSDGQIKMAVVNNKLKPIKNRTSNSNYNPALAGEKVAFIHSENHNDEFRNINDINNEKLLANAVIKYEIDDKINPIDVYIFNNNYFTFEGEKAVIALNKAIESSSERQNTNEREQHNLSENIEIEKSLDLVSENKSSNDDALEDGSSENSISDSVSIVEE
jgi:hypothetical protein